jgi:putative peptidoglycan lipid II flippase
VNAVLAVGLASVFGYVAAAIGTTVSGWAMCVALWLGARKLDGAIKLDGQLKRRAPMMLLASVLMGLGLIGTAMLLSDFLETGGLRYGALAILVLTGMTFYGGIAVATGAIRLGEVRGAFRRGA